MFASRRRVRVQPVNTEGSLRRAKSNLSPAHLLMRSPSSKAVPLPESEDDETSDEDPAAPSASGTAALARAKAASPMASPSFASPVPPPPRRPLVKRKSSLSRLPVREPPAETWAAFSHEGGAVLLLMCV